jgi:hypothetical protein
MKTVVILVGPRQVEQLIDDLKAGGMAPGTRTVALVLSDHLVEDPGGVFSFPREARIYVGPIHTLGFTGTVDEIRRHLCAEDKYH